MEEQVEYRTETCRYGGGIWETLSSGFLGSAQGSRWEGGCGLRCWQFEERGESTT